MEIRYHGMYDSGENKPDYIKGRKFNLKGILWAQAGKFQCQWLNNSGVCAKKNAKMHSCYQRDNINEGNKSYYDFEDSAARFQSQ
jgi:hypothetical protein